MVEKLATLFLKPKVFVCHVPGNQKRALWLKRCVRAWEETGAEVEVLTPLGSPHDFQRERRRMAEERVGRLRRFYILADDDCLPLGGPEWIARGLAVLRSHGLYAQLAPLPSNENIVEWTPAPVICPRCLQRREEHFSKRPDGSWTCLRDGCGSIFRSDGYYTRGDKEVMEHVSIGGIRFVRRGCMKEWPPMVEWNHGYDGVQAEALRERGWRVGFVRDIKFEHLGVGESTVWVT